MTRARLASEIGPIERQEPIPLVGDAMMRLERYKADYICGHRLCMGRLGIDIKWSEEAGTTGVLHCMTDPKHRRIRRPRLTQKPYGIGNMKGDQR